ncbi:MAG: response regulator, partial [Phenylobacterium sp.]|nr:response regulator [Phenylobacterium sp.]
KVIELMLAAAGVEVTTVENGYEAVEAWRSGGYDAVLMDLRMPVTDGLSAIRAIRKDEVSMGRSRTPTIVLSANTSPEDRAASAAAGADGHIAKPIRVEALFAALNTALTPQAAQAV